MCAPYLHEMITGSRSVHFKLIALFFAAGLLNVLRRASRFHLLMGVYHILGNL